MSLPEDDWRNAAADFTIWILKYVQEQRSFHQQKQTYNFQQFHQAPYVPSPMNHQQQAISQQFAMPWPSPRSLTAAMPSPRPASCPAPIPTAAAAASRPEVGEITPRMQEIINELTNPVGNINDVIVD